MRKRILIALGFPLLVAGFILLLARLDSTDDRAALEAARDSLAAAAEEPDPARRRQLATYAVERLEESSISPLDASRGLLEWAARLVLSPAIGQSDELDDLLGEADVASRVTAARVAFATGSPRFARKLVDAGLAEPAEDPSVRVEALRLSIMLGVAEGREQRVLDECRQLAELAPDDPRPWLVTAQINLQRSDLPGHVAAARKYLALSDENDPVERLALVESLLELGLTDEARSEMEALEAPSPDADEDLRTRVALVEASLLLQDQRIDEASTRVAEVLELAPERFEARLLEGRIALARDEVDRAIASLEPLVREHAGDHEVHYLLGRAFARAGRVDEARRHLARHQRLLDLEVEAFALERQARSEPENMDVRRRLAGVLDELGRAEQARTWRDSAKPNDG